MGFAIWAATIVGVSAVAAVLLGRIATTKDGALAAALMLGILTGYAALPDWMPWLPKFHWHWLPYLGIVGGGVGMLGGLAGLARPGRFLALMVASVLAASWLLTPDWDGLLPRPVLAAALAVYVVVIFFSSFTLSRRLPALELLVYLFAVCSAVAVCCAAAVSLKYGQIGALLALSLLGCLLATSLGGLAREGLVTALPGIAIFAGGLAFVGYIEPDPALPRLLLIPLTPLVLMLMPARAIAWQAVAIRAAVFGVSLGVLCGFALWP